MPNPPPHPLPTPLPNPLSVPLSVPLSPGRLYRNTDATRFDFETTDDLTPLPGLMHQTRAREAVGFGLCISQPGFNVFATGDASGRVRESLRLMLDEAALGQKPACDWVYVNNFADPRRPKALPLPPNRAPSFRKAVHDLLEELKASLRSVFESEEYQKHLHDVGHVVRARGQSAFAALAKKGQDMGVAVVRTPSGFSLAPMRDGKIVPPEAFDAWPDADQQAARTAIEALETDLEDTLRIMPRLEKEQRDAVLALNRETAGFTMAPPLEEARAAFQDLPDVLAHITAIAEDILDNIALFALRTDGPPDPAIVLRLETILERCEVNVLVTRSGPAADAPVIEELHPTLGNLVGRVEYMPSQGALVTNFLLIKAGALHRANGGTLLLDAKSLLSEPYSWPALKRALTRQDIMVEDAARLAGVAAPISLEPDPIPLSIKIVLFGDRALYYAFAAAEPDLARHFKVLADFDDELDRDPANEAMLARMIGVMAKEEHLRPFDRDAVARIIEHSARLADDQQRLTLRVDVIRDLLTEVNHWAGAAGRAVAGKADVEHAITQQIVRVARIRDLGQAMILRDIALVDTDGARVGQVNGLSVMSVGGFAFGRPARITCQARPGSGHILDIEREVELGGPLHSKGVLILTGFLSGRYGQHQPLSLNASLVFEQSYGGVDGDSASSTELYALLSAISGLPLRQDIAVTGSVNQHGEVQAIGGANQKIEGFFDICAHRGLTGAQGVMIPASNALHLMLRADVVAACAAGRFSVWPIETIDQGIALLTGHPAGTLDPAGDPAGAYPPGSVNRAVADRLRLFAAAVADWRPGDRWARGGLA